MKHKVYNRILDWYTDNDLVALVPEWWALEALLELEKQLVVLPLVNRDYDSYFSNAGDVVNLNRTGDFTAVRKQKGDPVTVQTANASADTVKLDQHFHVSYYLDDQDIRSTMGDLRPKYIQKAAIAIAEAIDLVILGETYNFLDNMAGSIGSAVTDQDVRDLSERFTRNNNPRAGRNCIVGPATENDLLGIDRFVEARMIGDGQAIRNNMLGHIRGFDFYVASQVPEVQAQTATNVVNDTNQIVAVGDDDILVTDGGQNLVAGNWFVFEDDDQPHRILTITGDPVTAMTFTPPANKTVAAGKEIQEYTSPAVVNKIGGYPIGYSDEIVVDGAAADNTLKVGQGITFTVTAGGVAKTERYTIIGKSVAGTIVSITLNRPLDAALADNDIINPIPPANYNLAFRKDALTFVNRPLQPADPGSGVNAAWNSYGGIALRVTIGYDQTYMGQRVTLDTLCGVKTLDADMGGVLLS